MSMSSGDGRLLWVNDAFCVLLGRTWAEVIGRPIADFTDPTDVIVAERIRNQLLTGETTRGECELRHLRPNGSTILARLSMSVVAESDTAEPPIVLGQVLDITDFKIVNDGLGHAAGEEFLVEAGHRLRQCVRPTDTVARMGGDEFVMVCEVDHIDLVTPLCERVAAALARPYDLDGKSLQMSASIGVVVGDDVHEPAELLRDADVAMYRSKADDRGRATVFTARLRAEAVERLEQEADLRVALREGQLEVHYQPVICCADASVYGAEALARWRHPDRGLLMPGDFLPAAERSSLIVDVGTAVLHAACRQLATWQQAGLDLRVSINISPRQLLDRGVVDTVLSACDQAGARPAGLVLELTENALIEALGIAGARLRRLRDAGVGVALDDFGTGYSSLQYLRDLPVDMVKDDRTFVRGLGHEDDGALAEAIVGLGDALDLTTVAEGVETYTQLRRLRAMGYGYGYGYGYMQGYLLGRPAPAAQLDLTPRW